MQSNDGKQSSSRANILGLPWKPVWINPYEIARRLPNLIRELPINLGTSDKIFSSQWLSETEVLIGSKCNKLYLTDISNGRILEIPKLNKTGSLPSSTSSCGIHSIRVSPGGEHVATGGHNPNYLAVYSLPYIIPLTLGEAHTDWIFDVQWLTNNLLISGSRDSSMALWSISHIISTHDGNVDELNLAENVPIMEPVCQFSNVAEHRSASGERVRSLAYNSHSYEMASLQVNSPCGAHLHFWDVFTFQQVSKVTLPYCGENVCVEVDSDGTHLYAAGSRSHIVLIDSREPSPKIARSVKSLDNDCGVRSLAFNQQLLSIGTGAGHLYFYDMRKNTFLLDNTGLQPCSLTASEGWLKRDQTYHELFSGSPRPPNAIYTHSYSPLRTKIFAAGGPLTMGLIGNYASVWM